MAVVTSIAPGNFIVPGSFLATPTPQQVTPAGPNTGLLAIVGTGSTGTPNTIRYGSDAATAVAAIGANTQLPFSAIDAAENGALPEARNLAFVRVTDGTDTAATSPLLDATGFATATASGTGGAGPNQTASVTLTNGSNVVTVPAITLAAAGSPAVSMAAIAAAINASPAVSGPTAFLQPATTSGNALVMTALASGVGGNAISYQIALTGAGFSVNPNGQANLSGGAAPGILGTFVMESTGSGGNSTAAASVGNFLAYKTPSGSTSPVVRLTLYGPNNAVEVFDNIVAYATAGGGLDIPTLKTNIGIAVNVGTSARAASMYQIFTPGTSTAAPLIGAFQAASGGTDGASGVTTAMLLGSTSANLQTGMYVLHKMIQGGTFMIAGLTDCAAAQTMAAFAQAEMAICAISLGGPGTTPDQATATKNAFNVSSKYVIACMESPYYLDPFTGTSQLKNPVGSILGTIASIDPWQSPLNKPDAGKVGVLATEWTATQFPDETELQSNNITYLKKFGGGFVVFNDRMSDGTPVIDVRCLNYYGALIQQIGNQFIGQTQPAAVNNATIQNYISDIKALLQPDAAYDAKGNPTGNPSPRISSYTVSGSSNTVTTIEQGFLIANVAIQTLSGIRYVLAIAIVGNAVQIQAAA